MAYSVYVYVLCLIVLRSTIIGRAIKVSQVWPPVIALSCDDCGQVVHRHVPLWQSTNHYNLVPEKAVLAVAGNIIMGSIWCWLCKTDLVA